MKTVDLLKAVAGTISCCTLLFNCEHNNNKGKLALGVTPNEGLNDNGEGSDGGNGGVNGSGENSSMVGNYNKNEIGKYGVKSGLNISSEINLYERYINLMKSVNEGIPNTKPLIESINDISRFKGLLNNNNITEFPYIANKSQCYKAIFSIHKSLCEILKKEKSTQPPKYKFSDKFDSRFTKLKDFLTEDFWIKEGDGEKGPVKYLDIVLEVLHEMLSEDPSIIGQSETMLLAKRKLFMDQQGVEKTIQEYIKNINVLFKNSKNRRNNDVNKIKTCFATTKNNADTEFTNNENLINNSHGFRDNYAYNNTINELRRQVKDVENRVDITKKQGLIKFDSSSPKYAYNGISNIDITPVFDNIFNNIKSLQEVVKNVKSVKYDEETKKELLQKNYNEIINSMFEFIIYGIEANQWLIATESLKPDLYYLTENDKENAQVEKKITDFFNYFANEGSGEKTDFYVNRELKELFGKIKQSFETECKKLKQETGQNNAIKVSLDLISGHITEINNITRKDSAAKQFFVKLELLYNTFLNGHLKYGDKTQFTNLVKCLLRHSGNGGDGHFRDIPHDKSLEGLLNTLAGCIDDNYEQEIDIDRIKDTLDEYTNFNKSYNDRDGISPSSYASQEEQCTDLNTLDLIFSNLVEMQKVYYKDLRLNDDYRKNIDKTLKNISEFFVGIVNRLLEILGKLNDNDTYKVSSYQSDVVDGFYEDLKKMVFKPGDIVSVDDKFQAFKDVSTDNDIINNSNTFGSLFKEVFISPFEKIANFMNGNVADKKYMNKNLYIAVGANAPDVINLGGLLKSIDDAVGEYNNEIVEKIIKDDVVGNKNDDRYVFKLGEAINLADGGQKARAKNFGALELPVQNSANEGVCKNQLANLKTLFDGYSAITELSDRIYYFSNAICALYKSLPPDMQALVYEEDGNTKVGSKSFGKLINRLVDIQYRITGDTVNIISNSGLYHDFIKESDNLVQLRNMKDNEFKLSKNIVEDGKTLYKKGDNISFIAPDQTIYKRFAPLFARLCFTNEVLKNGTSLDDLFIDYGIDPNTGFQCECYYDADKVKQTLFTVTGLEKYRNGERDKVYAGRVLERKYDVLRDKVWHTDSDLQKRLKADVTKVNKLNQGFMLPAFSQFWMFGIERVNKIKNDYLNNSGFFITTHKSKKGGDTPENGIYYFPSFFKDQAKSFKVNDEGEYTFDDFVKYLKEAWKNLADDGVKFGDLKLKSEPINWENGKSHNVFNDKDYASEMYKVTFSGGKNKKECLFEENENLRHFIAGTLDGIGNNSKLVSKLVEGIDNTIDVVTYEALVGGYRGLLDADLNNKYYKAARNGACKVISGDKYQDEFAGDNIDYKLCDDDKKTSAFNMIVSQHFAHNHGISVEKCSEKCKNIANLCAAAALIRKDIIYGLVRDNAREVKDVIDQIENKIKNLKIQDVLNIKDTNFKSSKLSKVLHYMANSGIKINDVKDGVTEANLQALKLLSANAGRDTYKLVYKGNGVNGFSDSAPLKTYIEKFKLGGGGNDIAKYLVQGKDVVFNDNVVGAKDLFGWYKGRIEELNNLLGAARPDIKFGTDCVTKQKEIIGKALIKMVKMFSTGAPPSEVKKIEDKAKGKIGGVTTLDDTIKKLVDDINNLKQNGINNTKILFCLLFAKDNDTGLTSQILGGKVGDPVPPAPGAPGANIPPAQPLLNGLKAEANGFKNTYEELLNVLDGNKNSFPSALDKTQSSSSSSDNAVKNLINLVGNVDTIKELKDKFGKIDFKTTSIDTVCNNEYLINLVKDVNVLINGGGETSKKSKITNGWKNLETVFKDAFRNIVDNDIVGYWATYVKEDDVEKLFGYKEKKTVSGVFDELCDMVDYCSENDGGVKILKAIVEGNIGGAGINMYDTVREDDDDKKLTYDNINNLLIGKLGVKLTPDCANYKYKLEVDGAGKDGLGHMLKNLEIFEYVDTDSDEKKTKKKLEDLLTNLYRIRGLKKAK